MGFQNILDVLSDFNFFQIHVVGYDTNSTLKETGVDVFDIVDKNLTKLFERKKDNQLVTLKVLLRNENFNDIDKYLSYIERFECDAIVVKMEQNFTENIKLSTKIELEEVRQKIYNHSILKKFSFLLRAWCKDETQRLQVVMEHLRTKELFWKALEQKDICFDHGASLILVLYAHASMIATFFEVAGHPIKFLVGILGPTNSRKTSISITICKSCWAMGMKADAEFTTATKAGIEKEISRLKDGVAVIDDLKPGITKTQQNGLDEKFDQLVRAYGDRVSKKRMLDFSGNQDDKYFPVGGGCVTTMEQLTGVMSSLSRVFISEIGRDDVDNLKLAYYQEHPWIMGTHLYDFLHWVTLNSDRVIGEIRDQFDSYRKEKKWRFERFSEMYATFKTIAFLLVQYATERQFFNVLEEKNFLEEVEYVVIKEIDEMEQRIRQYDKGLVVLEALDEALETGKLQPVVDTPENCRLNKGCYFNDQFIFLQLRLLHNTVYDFVHENHINVHFQNKEEILQLLLQRKIIESRDYGGTIENVHKLPQPKGNTKRYLYVYRDRLKKELQDIY